uniref:hypothetical protein n=1 Tax=Thaumasiovibrio occultus TaxID=1891184 RepID=UPI00131DCCB6|nr:hypothetical protein [Thaumasiovibrio occultus]
MKKSANKIYSTDLAPAGFCCSGVREWMANQGISWNEFVKHGMTIERAKQFNDPQVDKVIAWVERKRKA